MRSFAIYMAAALAEIAGCFASVALVRLSHIAPRVLPGMAAWALFASLLSRVVSDLRGRAYASYGGVYIASSLLWLWIVEGARPDRWDLIGAAICFLGAAVILFGPRPA